MSDRVHSGVRIHRQFYQAISTQLASHVPVVLLGPRQSGKTTLARQIATAQPSSAIYLDVQRPSDLLRLEHLDAFLQKNADRLCIIDGIQLTPQFLPTFCEALERQPQEVRENIQILMLGSAALPLLQEAPTPLTRQLVPFELTPLDAMEISAYGTIENLWNRGGYPDSFLSHSDQESLVWRQQFIRSYVERDIPMFASRLPREGIVRLWIMLAHAQGSAIHVSRLASNLGISATAVNRYTDLLIELLLVRRLQPWSSNSGKRLIRTPRLYIRDSGIMHALIEVKNLAQLLGHPVADISWKSFVIENLIRAAGDAYQSFFYHSEDGTAIDLVLERNGVIAYAVEISRSPKPQPSKGFLQACEALEIQRSLLVHSGDQHWQCPQIDIEALSLPTAMQTISGQE